MTTTSPKTVNAKRAKSEKSEARRNQKDTRKRSARRMTLKKKPKRLAIRTTTHPSGVERRRKRMKRKFNLRLRSQLQCLKPNPTCQLLRKFAALLI